MSQGDLFGMPEPDPAQSQFFTPIWLARRMAKLLVPGSRVLEPCAGSGNLARAAMTHGRAAEVVAIERDPRWFAELGAIQGVRALSGDFFDFDDLPHSFDAAFMNPPFEDEQHMGFVEHALSFARRVVGVFPAGFEYGQERDRRLWQHVVPTFRARLPERPRYLGDGGSFESVVLVLERRREARRPHEAWSVIEQVWWPSDVEAA